jgi:hypothetical protein
MIGIPLRKIQLGFRAVVLFIVFAGLLFSRGEGIRLFPFPFTQASQNASSELQNDEEFDYEKNLHRFESNQTNSQPKIQPGNLQIYQAEISNRLCHSSFFRFSSAGKADFSSNPQIFKSPRISALSGSRAPPVS